MRWVILDANLHPKKTRCLKCAMVKAHGGMLEEKNYNWKGGHSYKYNKHYYRLRDKKEAFLHYVKDEDIQCADPYSMHKVPIVDMDLLTIDHINGDGHIDRKIDNHTYRKLRREGYPSGVQVLCWNCQAKKATLNHERGWRKKNGERSDLILVRL